MSTFTFVVGGLTLGWILAHFFGYDEEGRIGINRKPLPRWMILLAVGIVALGVLSVAWQQRQHEDRDSFRPNRFETAPTLLVAAPSATSVWNGKGRSAFATDQRGIRP